MPTELTRLRASPEALSAVPLLAPGRHLHLRVDAEAAPRGFVRGVAAVDLWTSTGAAPPGGIEDSISQLADRGVELAIFDVASFGVERLIEEVFFALFVPFSYCLGDADNPMNLDTLRRVATPDVLLTLAFVDGAPAAASLFQPSARTPHERYSASEMVAGGIDMVASAARDAQFDDVFFHVSCQMLEASGFAAVRVRKTPWVTDRTAARWLRDVSRAEQVAWEERTPADHFSWQPAALAPGEGLLVFEVADRHLRPRCLGTAGETLPSIEREVNSRLLGEAARRGGPGAR